jgi:medium-chain acyl-[acyl-carrier-protein] hydrolase
MFYRWPDQLPDTVEVCCANLPGRGKRIFDPPFESMAALQSALVPQVPVADKPFAFFGHSLGAQVAFELAMRVRERYGTEPNHLFVSGCFAPHTPHPHPIHHLEDPEFLRELRLLGGVPQDVADDSELMELMMPMLRADFTVAETYHRGTDFPLTCPITAFAGDNDPIASADAVASWKEHTTGSFNVKVYPGDHFFIHKFESDLLRVIKYTLRPSPGMSPR